MPRPGPGVLANGTLMVVAAALLLLTACSHAAPPAASKIVRCSKQARAYSVLRYKFPHGSPFKGVSASGTGGGYFGQGQPVPPANQTVSLTC